MGNPLARLLEVAVPQHGLFSVAQAARAGVDREQARRMASSGVLEHRDHGIYRVTALRCTPLTTAMEAVLWSDKKGAIGGEAALLVWGLLEDLDGRVRVDVPAGYRVRRISGNRYILGRLDDLATVTTHDGIPTVSAETAVAEAIEDGVRFERLDAALRIAEIRGVLPALAGARLRLELLESQSDRVLVREAGTASQLADGPGSAS